MTKKNCVMMWVDPEFKKKMHIERAEKGYPSIIKYTQALSNQEIMFETLKKEIKEKNVKKYKKKKPFSFF